MKVIKYITNVIAIISVITFKLDAKFNNVVQYPSDFNQEVYKFDLTFDEGLSMSINAKNAGEFDPVDLNLTDGKFYVRNKDLFMKCNLNELVTNKEDLDSIVTVDGRHRTMIFVNDQFPGPPIVVPKDAMVEITVRNKMRATGLSVHWHGQTQQNSFQMDGVSRITQCPINPGEYFVYKFKATEVGTHWYHSHSSAQRTDGAIGPFIVFEKEKITKNRKIKIAQDMKAENTYEKEYFFFVQDWQHLNSEETVNLPIWGNTKFWNGFEKENECFYPIRIQDASMMMMKPDSFIINGKGWNKMPDNIDKLSSFSETAKKLPLEKFSVLPNKKYLFRAIGANMAFPIVISVSGHKLNLVATDGNPINSIEDLDYIIIHGGERYDFELVTKPDGKSKYYIIVQALASFDYNFSPLKVDHFGIGILDYEGSNENIEYIPKKCSLSEQCVMTNCLYLPLKNDKIKCVDATKMNTEESHISKFDKEHLFKNKYSSDEFEEYFFNYHFSGDPILRSSVNGKQYIFPSFPPFFPSKFDESIKGHECPNSCSGSNATCHCSSKTQISTKKVIQFTLFNIGLGQGVQGTSHPVHMHGHHFYVISIGYPSYYENGTFFKNNKDLECNEDETDFCNGVSWSNKSHAFGNVPNANFFNPVKKDTIIVPIGGYVVVRFYSDNIGYWFFHCHVEVHATEGMATLIQEGSHDEIRKIVEWKDMHTCNKGYNLPESTKPSSSSSIKLNYLFKTFYCLIIIKKIFFES